MVSAVCVSMGTGGWSPWLLVYGSTSAGMQPLLYSEAEAGSGRGWRRVGRDISYYRQGEHYTLTWRMVPFHCTYIIECAASISLPSTHRSSLTAETPATWHTATHTPTLTSCTTWTLWRGREDATLGERCVRPLLLQLLCLNWKTLSSHAK